LKNKLEFPVLALAIAPLGAAAGGGGATTAGLLSSPFLPTGWFTTKKSQLFLTIHQSNNFTNQIKLTENNVDFCVTAAPFW
jgi:hypothetical protein